LFSHAGSPVCCTARATPRSRTARHSPWLPWQARHSGPHKHSQKCLRTWWQLYREEGTSLATWWFYLPPTGCECAHVVSTVTCTWENLSLGTAISCTGADTVPPPLLLAQLTHSRHQFATSQPCHARQICCSPVSAWPLPLRGPARALIQTPSA
jgi:hypothetical protein